MAVHVDQGEVHGIGGGFAAVVVGKYGACHRQRPHRGEHYPDLGQKVGGRAEVAQRYLGSERVDGLLPRGKEALGGGKHIVGRSPVAELPVGHVALEYGYFRAVEMVVAQP